MRVLEFRVEIWWAKCLSTKDVDGRTPLHYCVSAGHDRSVLEALLCIRGDTTHTTPSSSAFASIDKHTHTSKNQPKHDIRKLPKSISRSSVNGGMSDSHDSLRHSTSGSSGLLSTNSVPSRGVGYGGDHMMMVERGRGRFYEDNPGNQTQIHSHHDHQPHLHRHSTTISE